MQEATPTPDTRAWADDVLYEDNHLLAVYKHPGEIVQGDKTGDATMLARWQAYIKERYHKPGNVFLGSPHRLDRPVSGVVLFARTSKALTRLADMFRQGQVHKTYLAITCAPPPQNSDTLTHWLLRNEQQNKSYAYDTPPTGPRAATAKQAILDYRLLAHSTPAPNGQPRYYLLAINLRTGRHHQIRCQLAAVGCPIRGDLKYGAPRSLPNAGISLHAYTIDLLHPVTHQPLHITAPLPHDRLWQSMASSLHHDNNFPGQLS